MPGHGSSHSPVTLKELATLDAFSPPPYGYDEFARRRDRMRAQRRVTGFAAAASFAALAVITGFVLFESRGELRVGPPSMPVAAAPLARPDSHGAEPALVEVERLVLRNDLEDRIAWFDAALSAGRVEAVPDDDLMELELARAQLARSLQHVSYAHALLEY